MLPELNILNAFLNRLLRFFVMQLFSPLHEHEYLSYDELDKGELTEVGINGMECIAVGQVSRCSCWRTGTGMVDRKIRFVSASITRCCCAAARAARQVYEFSGKLGQRADFGRRETVTRKESATISILIIRDR